MLLKCFCFRMTYTYVHVCFGFGFWLGSCDSAIHMFLFSYELYLWSCMLSCRISTALSQVVSLSCLLWVYESVCYTYVSVFLWAIHMVMSAFMSKFQGTFPSTIPFMFAMGISISVLYICFCYKNQWAMRLFLDISMLLVFLWAIHMFLLQESVSYEPYFYFLVNCTLLLTFAYRLIL